MPLVIRSCEYITALTYKIKLSNGRKGYIDLSSQVETIPALKEIMDNNTGINYYLALDHIEFANGYIVTIDWLNDNIQSK
ncbi:hypothetical protein I3271_08440 [Photobacterium leiognathi]|uniref:hypothetical protein n=1 Tax=Photobacterium leiognathi TaxID=553611 RepID=UPI001EDEDDD2|nr:hypothetical protein [Photobacterium leiognathi]MCG3884715.1 hypothetical protein [Photobacterium leiognathi]